MRLDKLTLKTQEAMETAQGLMSKYSHQQMEGEHLLAGLLEQEEGVVRPILQKLEVDIPRLKKQVEMAVERLPRVHGGGGGVHASRALVEIIDQAWKEAERLKDEYLSTEHILLALAGTGRRPNCCGPPASPRTGSTRCWWKSGVISG